MINLLTKYRRIIFTKALYFNKIAKDQRLMLKDKQHHYPMEALFHKANRKS